MKKGNILFFLLLVVVIAGIHFIFISSGNEPKKASFKRKFEQSLTQDKTLQSEELKNAYRIFSFKDSLLVLTEKGNFVIDQHLNGMRPIQLSEGGTIYYASQFKDSLVTFNIDKREMTLRTSDTILQKKIEGLPGNAIYNNGKFYFTQGDVSITDNKTYIVSWDPATNLSDTINSLNKIVDHHISGYRDCLSQTLEGNFFSIDPAKVGYYFYYGGYFVVCEQGKLDLKPTVDSTPFQKYEVKTVMLPGGRKAAQCFAENSSHYNYAAAAGSNNIFILSGVISLDKDKKLYVPVDVYDAKHYSYRHTLRVPMKSMTDYAYLMTVVGDYLYLYFNESKLIRYKINSPI